ncbi:hypothetical protein AEQU1_00938 [Aequorivita sp. CIP111184]|nr:hypothetical protein AEQU1_00938 [Aequorivita sp. CIP111184]
MQLSILFFIVCFSGTLATLSHEMDWLFIPESRAVPQKEMASKNQIVSNFSKKYPNATFSYWEHSREPYLCDIISKRENNQTSYVFANPYTGKIQGESQLTFQRFFRDLHYYLFFPFQQIGNYVVLIFGFLLLISLLTALTFYKKWWKKLFQLKIGKGNLVFFRSLHRLVGLWSIPFILLISLTGTWYFLERANVADIKQNGNTERPEVYYTLAEKDSLKEINAINLDFDRALNVAKETIPELKPGTMSVTENYLYITGKSDVPLVRERANRIYLNPINYKPIKVQNAEDIGTVMYINDIADPLHFGYWGGLTTKIIWFFFGLAISSLILTGIWITLKRKAIKRKGNKQKVMGKWRYVNWGLCAAITLYMYYIIISGYQASNRAIAVISIGWIIFIALGYYIFVYRLSKVIEKN